MFSRKTKLELMFCGDYIARNKEKEEYAKLHPTENVRMETKIDDEINFCELKIHAETEKAIFAKLISFVKNEDSRDAFIRMSKGELIEELKKYYNETEAFLKTTETQGLKNVREAYTHIINTKKEPLTQFEITELLLMTIEYFHDNDRLDIIEKIHEKFDKFIEVDDEEADDDEEETVRKYPTFEEGVNCIAQFPVTYELLEDFIVDCFTLIINTESLQWFLDSIMDDLGYHRTE
jgi:hypothetical protein